MNPALVKGLIQAGIKAWDLVDGLQAADELFDKIGQKAKLVSDYISKLGDRWYEIQDMSFKAARTMAMSREQALRYNESLIKSTKELAAQYGITTKELNDFQKSYSEAIGRNVILTREQMAHMSALSKITDSATAAQLVDDFDKIGVGIAGTTAKIGLLQERAKALGINATKATKTLKDNIRLAASYSFKNGVADIEKMSLRATSLRMDMNAVMNAADKFMDIEGAIGTSARLQMLGGSFGAQFANPMGAMYEAMADPKSFMDRLEKMIAGKGRYDEKTGQVTFDPVTMMQMREAAKQLGMSVEQLTTPAMSKVQEEKVMQEFARNANKNGFKPEDIAAIKNLARTNVDEKTGKHYVTLLNDDGEPEKINVEDLTREQLKVAQDSQMTEEGLFNDVQDIKTILERVHGRARETKSMKEGYEGMKEWWNTTIANIQDTYMPGISNIFNGFTNWLGKQYFADGGIVKPIHAEVGAVVPGNSYYGDKVPAMVNSGEMILNKGQQKSMFNLINSLAINGGMMYGMNKVGGKFGVGGIGSTMLLANMLGGGHTDISTLIEAHFIKKAIKSINPLKTSISEIGKVSETAAETTNVFSGRWKDLTNTLSRDFSSVTKKLSTAAKTYFSTGRWGRIIRGTGQIASTIASKASHYGGITAAHAKTIGEWIGKYTVKPIAKGAKWLSNTKPVVGARGWAETKYIRAKLGYRDLVKPKAQEYSKLVKNLFNTGSSAQASKAASRLQTPEVAMTGRSTGVSKIAETATKETSSIVKAAGKGGKMLSTLGKVGKVVGKKLPVIGNVLAVGSAISDMSSASSQYDAKIDEIEKSGLSDREKARAKDKAAKEKNASYGSSIGSAAGMAIGGAIGSALGPLGSIAGMWLGEKAGSFLGKGIGSLFGGGKEDKLIEEEKEKAKAVAGNNEEIVKILKTIEGKMPGSSSVASNFGLKAMELETSAIRPLVDIGKNVAIKATNAAAGAVKAITGADRTKIDLNVSGTIKIEGGNKSADLDISKLIDNPDFKRQLAEMITKRVNETSNAGKQNKENVRNNVANTYNKNNTP